MTTTTKCKLALTVLGFACALPVLWLWDAISPIREPKWQPELPEKDKAA